MGSPSHHAWQASSFWLLSLKPSPSTLSSHKTAWWWPCHLDLLSLCGLMDVCFSRPVTPYSCQRRGTDGHAIPIDTLSGKNRARLELMSLLHELHLWLKEMLRNHAIEYHVYQPKR
ncbi:hypothetical protein LY78DRAFT_664178 [Colletotrichum sublineola]|nr:hypothetical protein LY78DRAFT_664178 [Colletotrichum sublineola]